MQIDRQSRREEKKREKKRERVLRELRFLSAESLTQPLFVLLDFFSLVFSSPSTMKKHTAARREEEGSGRDEENRERWRADHTHHRNSQRKPRRWPMLLSDGRVPNSITSELNCETRDRRASGIWIECVLQDSALFSVMSKVWCLLKRPDGCSLVKTRLAHSHPSRLSQFLDSAGKVQCMWPF